VIPGVLGVFGVEPFHNLHRILRAIFKISVKPGQYEFGFIPKVNGFFRCNSEIFQSFIFAAAGKEQ
jgi:hypothetical protein